jgi:hypothetical protein
VTLGEDPINPDRYFRNTEALDAIVPLRGKKLREIGSGYGISLAIMLQRFDVDAVALNRHRRVSMNHFNAAGRSWMGIISTARELSMPPASTFRLQTPLSRGFIRTTSWSTPRIPRRC